ncbi:hypothetical protein Ciccas_003636 [Cichlidogyrus casuarinus]|uniref:Uncharacterized protein n=1 Tax=Cichlidogyrus casuarinus TaxID=1844966 RepID=A0ABD2QDZ3_9PLAT
MLDTGKMVSENTCSPLWSLIVQHVSKKNHIPPDELHCLSDFELFFQAQTSVESKTEASLNAILPDDNEEEKDGVEMYGLLQLGHLGTAEWAARCLHLLLQQEWTRLERELPNLEECSACYTPVTHFFSQLAKQRGTSFGHLLPKTLTGLLRAFLQLWYRVSCEDHNLSMYEEQSWLQDSLLISIQRLALFAHTEIGRRPVLYVFQFANRLALDELNNRRHCFVQRRMALKLTSNLLNLLSLCKRPALTELQAVESGQEVEEQPEQEHQLLLPVSQHDRKVPAHLAYLRVASRLISREQKNRDRLAFIAASNLPQEDNRVERKFSSVLSVRAKLRRRRREAQLRRALMSDDSEKSSEAFQKVLSLNSVSARNAAAEADALVDLIDESTECVVQAIDSSEKQAATRLWRQICAKTQSHSLRKRAQKEQDQLSRKALGTVPKRAAPKPEKEQSSQEMEQKRRRIEKKLEKKNKHNKKRVASAEDFSLRSKKRKLKI